MSTTLETEPAIGASYRRGHADGLAVGMKLERSTIIKVLEADLKEMRSRYGGLLSGTSKQAGMLRAMELAIEMIRERNEQTR